MNKNIKIFLIVFIISLPFAWGASVLEKRLENFFYWYELAKNPRLLAAQERQLSFQQSIRELMPIRNKNIQDLEVAAKSTISILVDNQGKEWILYQKNTEEILPIASLTKLMTAKIVLDNYDLSKEIQITKEAIDQEEDFGRLTAGKMLSVEYLLYPLLMESSNDAAFALANDYNGITEERFVQLMNETSQELELKNTYFFNPSGLDPEEPDQNINYSTAHDLVKLTKDLLKEPLLWEILATTKLNTYGPELINTNELLGKVSRMVGGKTGYTEEALGCFLVVVKAPKDKGYLINVILGTNDRFRGMEELIDWLQQAYTW